MADLSIGHGRLATPFRAAHDDFGSAAAREDIPRHAMCLRSRVHDDAVGRGADRDRSANGRGGGREGKDRAGYESAGGADGQDKGGEDGTPNSHDDLHASTEVDSLRAGPGGHARHG